MGILYLFTKFEFDRSTDDKDLLLDRNHWKHRQTESDTIPITIKDIGLSNEMKNRREGEGKKDITNASFIELFPLHYHKI